MTSVCCISSTVSLSSSLLLQRQRARAHDRTNIIQLLSDEDLDRHYQPMRSYHCACDSSSSSSSSANHLAAASTMQTSLERCCSTVVQRMRAPVSAVWSVVRCFDNPQAYKNFIRSCCVTSGDGVEIGSTRVVQLVSGLPAVSSEERLEILDDERHILSFKIIGGQHRLKDYCSVTTLHECEVDGKPGTIVLESYTVDVPEGNTCDDTRTFVDTIVKCNLHSLARLSELKARLPPTVPQA